MQVQHTKQNDESLSSSERLEDRILQINKT